MKRVAVKMVRIYLTEEKAHLDKLMAYLHDQEKVRGVTVFRGISGYGKSGVIHSSSLLDMSLNLPVVVEFYDFAEKIDQILENIDKLPGTMIEPGHIVSWAAEANLKG
ncbi:MAG TPA: DUF190 domain-containing protein [Gammaproteobacteria bacterium]|nr:DUF190 domain-containing protein [Gammaproteobacteria bacterium]